MKHGFGLQSSRLVQRVTDESRAESRAKVDLPAFISLFCALLSISAAPQLPEASQVLMGRQQRARVAS